MVQVSAVDVIQRHADEMQDDGAAGAVSLDEIARQVFPILKDLLRFERDRFGSR